MNVEIVGKNPCGSAREDGRSSVPDSQLIWPLTGESAYFCIIVVFAVDMNVRREIWMIGET
jgi:hypothetical protein